MIFYHIEFAKECIISNFIPKIPDETLPGEDITTNRICVSTSIEGCLSATAWGGLHLDDQPLGCLFRVYVFDETDFVKPEILEEKYGVLDAVGNQEFWFTTSRVPIDNFVISIKSYTYGDYIMKNGKLHTLIENLKYTVVDEYLDCKRFLDLTIFKDSKQMKKVVEMVLENIFCPEYCDFYDYYDNFEVTDEYLIYSGENLFYMELLIEQLNNPETYRIFNLCA